MNNISILMICVSNILCAVIFTFVGYKLSSNNKTIVIKENQTVEELVTHKETVYNDDEPAYEVTPELEAEVIRAYNKLKRELSD